jgi:hypothetical protein
MGLRSIIYNFNQNDSTSIDNYNPNKTSVGSLFRFYTGSNKEDRFLGPSIIGIARPVEESVAIPGINPVVIPFSNEIDWVFLADGAAAAVTRRVILYEYNKLTSHYTWKGSITVTYPIIGNKTIRSHDVIRKLYIEGTVSVNGDVVTGTGTQWLSSGLCVGSRIGIGTTDPTQVVQWREIITINSNTEIILDQPINNVTNVGYVIEDLRILQIHTNATAVNGGLFVIKGLRVENFTPTTTAIGSATTTDNIRASYWLSDAIPQTNTIGYGLAVDYSNNWGDEKVYILNAVTAANSRIYVYNHRAPLNNLSDGRTTDAFLFLTGNQTTTGNISVTNNGIIAVPNHGSGSGVKSLYWVTASRVYRSLLTDITNGSTSFHTDLMVEIPPGGTSTYAASSTLSNIIYDESIDSFIIFNTGAAGARSYVTKYTTFSTPFDIIFLSDTKQLDQSSADSGSPVIPSINASIFTGDVSNGILHFIRHSGAATLNQMYSLPSAAHQRYAFDTDQYVITPKFNVSDAVKLYEINVNNIKRLGSDTFATPTEAFRIFFRTNGIDDNTGSWIQLNDASNLEAIQANFIQFAFTFRIYGNICIPARLLGFTLTYEDSGTDSHYHPSVSLSSVTNLIFAYRQVALFDSINIPELRIRIFNSANDGLVLDDNTSTTTFGSFEYSNDSINWNPWDETENVVGNYIRYTAASLPNGIKVRVLLTQ